LPFLTFSSTRSITVREKSGWTQRFPEIKHQTMDRIKMQEKWGQKTTQEINDLLPSDWSYCFGLVSVPDGSGGGAWSLRLIRKGGGLTESDMREIGDLTRENISKWAES